MDQYFGATLLFKTKNKIIKGILKDINESKSQVIIENIETAEKINLSILEVEGLQIIELPKKDELRKGINETLNTYKLDIEKRSKCENQRKNTSNDSQYESLYKKDTYKSCDNYKVTDNLKMKNKYNLSDNENLLSKNDHNLNDNVKSKEPLRSIIDMNLYYKILHDSFSFFGPSEENFIFQTSQIFFDFISRFKAGSFALILNNSLFSKIGFILAEKFIENNFTFDVIFCDDFNTEFLKQSYFYTNSGGKVKTMLNKKYDNMIVCADQCKFDLGEFYKNRIFLLDMNIKSESFKNKVGFMYGMVNEKYKDFKGDIYLIDCGIKTIVYDKHRVSKRIREKMTKIK